MKLECCKCGMIANVDPWLHTERYGHRPVIKWEGKEYPHRGDGYFGLPDIEETPASDFNYAPGGA